MQLGSYLRVARDCGTAGMFRHVPSAIREVSEGWMRSWLCVVEREVGLAGQEVQSTGRRLGYGGGVDW